MKRGKFSSLNTLDQVYVGLESFQIFNSKEKDNDTDINRIIEYYQQT